MTSAVDAAAVVVEEEASVVDAISIDASHVAMRCDPPRVRDTVTLECTDHAACATGEDLVAGACVPSCGAPFTARNDKNECTCPPGLVDVRGAEFGGCVKPGELDFSKMCKAAHQHFDGSIVPRCKCDVGYVESFSGGLGLMTACVKPCKAPLPYDPMTDRCHACGADQDAVRGVCVAKCPPGSRRDSSTGQCECALGMFIDHGQCVHCMPGRVFDPATGNCNCAAGTEDWGYVENCLATCPAGQHRLHARCIPDCAANESNDEKTGACGACDGSANAFVFQVHGRAVCIHCSFDEVLDKDGACACRPGFRRANGHCVNP
jgi:hypothetical protein